MRFPTRDFLATGAGATSLVLLSLGGALLVTAVPVGIALAPDRLALPFIAPSLAILVVGLLLAARRSAVLRSQERLLLTGSTVQGTITDVRRNPWVRVSRRHPWTVRYRFEVGGTAREASEALWDLPASFTKGAPVAVGCCDSDPWLSVLRHRDEQR